MLFKLTQWTGNMTLLLCQCKDTRGSMLCLVTVMLIVERQKYQRHKKCLEIVLRQKHICDTIMWESENLLDHTMFNCMDCAYFGGHNSSRIWGTLTQVMTHLCFCFSAFSQNPQNTNTVSCNLICSVFQWV